MGTHHFFIANPQNDHKTLMISMPASQLRGCVFEPWLRVSFVEFVFHSHASSNISKTSMQTLYSFEGVNVSANDGLLIWCHAVEWQPIQGIPFLADWCHFKPQEMNFTYVSIRFFFVVLVLVALQSIGHPFLWKTTEADYGCTFSDLCVWNNVVFVS